MKYLTRFSEWSANDQLIFSSDAMEDAKHSFIDTIACILAGQKHHITKKIKKYNKNINQENSIYGDALLYGCQAGILDYDDYESAGSSHCSAPIISSILAFIKKDNCSYKQILEAWIVGYEIIIGLGLSLGYSHYEKGWHAASTLGTIGVAATIGRLLKLNSQQMLKALSIASSSSAGMKIQFGNEMKVVHLGLAAQAGLQAAYLAKENIEANDNFYDEIDGFKTLYGTSFSKKLDESTISRKLGFATVDYPVIKKPWPSCACTHRIVEASEFLYHKINSINDVDKVIIKTPEPFTKVSRFHIPNNEAEARFSPTYCAMITLKNGKILPEDFMNNIFLKEERQKLTNIAKVEAYKVPPNFTEMSPDFPCKVKIIMKNGTIFEKTIENVKGGKKRPMNINDLKIKFLECSKNQELFDLLLDSKTEKSSKFIDKLL